jgi:hypothetical protein
MILISLIWSRTHILICVHSRGPGLGRKLIYWYWDAGTQQTHAKQPFFVVVPML